MKFFKKLKKIQKFFKKKWKKYNNFEKLFLKNFSKYLKILTNFQILLIFAKYYDFFNFF